MHRSESPGTGQFMEAFRSRYRANDIVATLTSIADLRVAVVGDAIIDEYHFVRPYGMASKSASIAAQFLSAERYAGGALAIANHVAGFCRSVNLVTGLGAGDSDDFVRRSLQSNVVPFIVHRDDAPTVVKRRFVQPYLVTKLFEVAYFNDRTLEPQMDRRVADHLQELLRDQDLVIVADFGHGFMGPATKAVLGSSPTFVALNTQTNSINYGYNLVFDYPRADYVCIDEEECRLACRDRYGPLEPLIENVADTLNARVVTITRGFQGSVVYERGGVARRTPVLSEDVVDSVGAGDALLSITAPCVAVGTNPELVAFIGNVAGALATRIVGNKTPLDAHELVSFVREILP